MLNQQGSSTLLHCFFALILSMLLMIFCQLSRQHYFNMKTRAQTYLCFKYQIVQLDKYVHKMGSFNKELAALYPMQFLPEVGAGFKALHKSVMAIQNTYHLNYLRKVIKNPYCKKEQGLGFIHHLNYKTDNKLILSRSFNGVVPIKQNKSDIAVFSNLKPSKHGFYLNANIQIKDSFSTKMKFHSEEKNWKLNLKIKPGPSKSKALLPKQDLPNWKHSSGSPSICSYWFQGIRFIGISSRQGLNS